MRKVVVLNRISMDSFFAGPNGEIDWFIRDPEVDKATHAGGQSDTLLLGRVTYQMFESYWPHVAKDPNAPEGAKKMANELNEMTKVVFSKTLPKLTWENSELVKDGIAKKVQELKKGNGSDILIFGSGTIVQQLANEGLIDEYLLIVTPIILGTGKPLFKDVKKNDLKLIDSQSFDSGNVILHYKFAGK